MKKFLKMLLILIIITVILSVIVGLKPLMSRTCNLGDFGISLKIPYIYTESTKMIGENTLLNLYSRQNGIIISAIDLGADFWSSDILEERVDEYLNVISATNYDAQIQNFEKEIIEISGTQVGRTELEIVKPNRIMKMISFIFEEKNGNVAIEIYGEKEYMEQKQEEIEKIISTIKFGENRHVYEQNEVENNEIESNEIESNEIESNEIESNEVENNEIGNNENNNENNLSGEKIESGEQISGDEI